jgi:hypothetical protein
MNTRSKVILNEYPSYSFSPVSRILLGGQEQEQLIRKPNWRLNSMIADCIVEIKVSMFIAMALSREILGMRVVGGEVEL